MKERSTQAIGGKLVVLQTKRDDSTRFAPEILESAFDGICFRQVVDSIADSVVIHRDGRIVYANPSAVATIGAETLDQLIDQPIMTFVDPKYRQKVRDAIEQVMSNGGASSIVSYTGNSLDGRRVDIETIAVRISSAQGDATLNVCRDVTERKRTELALQGSEARFKVLADRSPEAIIAICERRIVLANRAAAGLLGVTSPSALIDQDVGEFCIDGKCRPSEHRVDSLEEGNAVTKHFRGRFQRSDGLAIDLDITSIPYMHDSQPAAYLIMRDVTEQLRDEQHYRYLARHDALTGLPNRLEFRRRLSAMLNREDGQRAERFAIHYLDLDYFKNVNDSLGHEIGDRLLQIVAARLRETVRSTDLVARLGGDEFAVLQGNALGGEAPHHLAGKLQRAIEKPCTVGDQLLQTSTTIGIAVYPDHGDDPDQLLRRADLALYHAKERGRNAVSYFCEDLDVRVRERDKLINQLIRAENGGEFEVHFQPIVSLQSGLVEAVEALLRWNHPERGLMTADDFIHAIEASREGQRIGAWVLHEACTQARNWEQAGIKNVRVAVNLSMPFVQRPDFNELVVETLRATGLDPSRLELELTERIIISAGAVGMASKLQKLRDLGVHVALDDFGTGYSSLALLKDLPVDRIKIDRSFVLGFGTSDDDTAIVRAVTNLGRSLNKRVTAEGVECPDVMDRLREEGCHDVQGYHLARPMGADALLNFLKRASA